jgi:acetyl-CoA C-acetyltransferase/acetyl-CoA acyltransferase
MGWGQVEADLTLPPDDPARLETTCRAVEKALRAAEIGVKDLATVECHDCFTMSGLLSVEAIGLAKPGEAPDYVMSGATARTGALPFNTCGGLIGWGHPVGGTGVRQAVSVWQQLTEKAGAWQVPVPAERPYALSVNMGGNDKTVIAVVYRRGA